MSPTDTWTARYRSATDAVVVDGDEIVAVTVVRVTKRLVIVNMDGEEMRYRADITADHGDGFSSALLEPSGRIVRGECPVLALEGDGIVTRVRAGAVSRADASAKVEALRARLLPLLRDAKMAELERVAAALDGPRVDVSVEDEWRGLVGLIGGRTTAAVGGCDWVPSVSLSRLQAAAVRQLKASLRREVADAANAGFERGQDLLRGLNDGTHTMETFLDRTQHHRHHFDAEVGRSRE